MENTILSSESKGYKKLTLEKEVISGKRIVLFKKTIFSIVYYEFEDALCSEAYSRLSKAKKAFKEFLKESNNLEN